MFDCRGFGWNSVISVMRFFRQFGLSFLISFFMLCDLSWNIVVVLVFCSSEQVGLLFSGMKLMFIGFRFFLVCLWLMIFIVYLMMVRVCRLRKLNFIRLVVFMLFLLNWVIRLLFFLLQVIGEKLVSLVGVIIMLLVCLLVLWVMFFSLRVIFQILVVFLLFLRKLWSIFFCLQVLFRVMLILNGIIFDSWLVRLQDLFWICVMLCIIVFVVMVLKVMIWFIVLCLQVLVMQLIIWLWFFMQKLMLKLGMEICFGLRKCLNSRLQVSGLRLVIFSMQVISELVFEFCLGFIGMLLFFVYLMKFIMMRK